MIKKGNVFDNIDVDDDDDNEDENNEDDNYEDDNNDNIYDTDDKERQ